MSAIINCHVIDPTNIGDALSAPARYFPFPGYTVDYADIRDLKTEDIRDKHLILGGGGLLFPRFLNTITQLLAAKQQTKMVVWGVGQQVYGRDKHRAAMSFDYAPYLDRFDLSGIRDFGLPQTWVPCASCMHPAFDRQRTIQHEFVVFSHKKFRLSLENFPRMTNDSQDFEAVLDFLGSGETILTSSYHGAYWGTLLGRKVLAFPFSSKFYTLKHLPALHPVSDWTQPKVKLAIVGKVICELRYSNQFSCSTQDWQITAQHCTAYPDSLAETRLRNQEYYAQVLDMLNS